MSGGFSRNASKTSSDGARYGGRTPGLRSRMRMFTPADSYVRVQAGLSGPISRPLAIRKSARCPWRPSATASSESAVPAPPVPALPSNSLATTVIRRGFIDRDVGETADRAFECSFRPQTPKTPALGLQRDQLPAERAAGLGLEGPARGHEAPAAHRSDASRGCPGDRCA